jgi:hypothetical protein
VSVLWNAGDASYPSLTDYATATSSDFLALGDLDNNGTLDIVAASGTIFSPDSSVTVLLNQGQRNFVSNVSYDAVALGKLALADLNHDGNLDLVQSDGQQYRLAVRLGLGDGTFGPTLQSATNNGGISMYNAVLGDLNGDGNLDLVSPDTCAPFLDVMLGVGDGTFVAVTPQAIAQNFGLGRLALGDLNGDGVLDLVSDNLVEWVGYQMLVMLGAGDGTFTCATASLASGADDEFFALGDVNGDKRLDLVVPNLDSESFTVLLNQPL